MPRLIDNIKTVMGCPPAALTGAAGDGDYVSMKNYSKLTIIIAVDNGTTVTGGDVTLKQAKDVGGTDEKALAFETMFANEDTGASDDLVETAVTSNTFTTDATNAKNLIYQIEVDERDLDVTNGYTSIRVDVASMANAVGAVIYQLSVPRHKPVLTLSAIVD